MGQIVSLAAKPKRCNLNQLSQVPTPAAGEHILVSSDNSMNAAGQGNFDCYIVGDGTKAATALELKSIAEIEITQSKNSVSAKAVYEFLYGNDYLQNITYNARQGTAINTTTQALAAEVDLPIGKECTFLLSGDTSILNGTMAVQLRNASYQGLASIQLSIGTPVTFTPTYNVKLIGVYVSGTNVRANGTLSLKITYNGDVKGFVENVGEMESEINGETFDSVTYPTTPNYPINTTTQALSYATNIPANTPFVLFLEDKEKILSSTLDIYLYDENYTKIGNTIHLNGNTASEDIILSSAVRYISVYIAGTYVGGSAPSSVVLSVYKTDETGLLVDVKQAKAAVSKITANYRPSSSFRNKTCLYIGDSISTENNFAWKRILENNYNLFYVRGAENSLWPANGGIQVIPPVSEPSSLEEKSIWYRCAGQRMGIYTFDCICLFGGTNDMNNSFYPNMELGTIDDTPYVDTLDGFTQEIAATLTATRPATLTFAASLMGCIEMLHRDFPTKTIILPTVFPSRGNYGNTTDASGMRLSEKMAILQMQIANKYSADGFNITGKAYGVIGVPFYWFTRTYENSVTGAMSKDGVHPNLSQARSMANLFAENLFL